MIDHAQHVVVAASIQAVRDDIAASDKVASAQAAARRMKDVDITSKIEYDGGAAAGAIINDGVRELQDSRVEANRPLRAAAKAVSAVYDEFIEPLGEAKASLDRKLADWRDAESARRALTRIEAEAAVNAAISDPNAPAVEIYIAPPPKTVDTGHGQATATSRWKYRIIDPALVPREFCVPATGLINAAVQAGNRSIPGVDIFEESGMAYRR